MNAAASPAPEPQATPVPPSPEELAKQARQFYENQWQMAADKERRRIALERGLMDKDGNITQRGNLLVSADKMNGSQVTLLGLRELVKLEGDTIRYVKDKNGLPRIATNKYGLPAWPKQRGRVKPHMSGHAHGIKNRSISIFKNLFSIHAQEAEIRAKNDGVEFVGVPTEDISKIGARAAKLGAVQFQSETRARKNKARRRQELSRRINYGIQARNTNVRAYCG